MVSGRYFSLDAPLVCLKWIPACCVWSVKWSLVSAVDGITAQQISIREVSRSVSAFTFLVKNKSTQRVGAFKCLFTLESAFERTPSCRQFVLCFNSSLRIGLIRIEFDIRCRENFIDVCTVFAMGEMERVITRI